MSTRASRQKQAEKKETVRTRAVAEIHFGGGVIVQPGEEFDCPSDVYDSLKEAGHVTEESVLDVGGLDEVM